MTSGYIAWRVCANVHFRRRGAGQACHNPRDTDTDGQPQTDHQSLQVSNCKFPRRLRVGIVHINVPLFSPTYPSDRERRTSNMTKTNLIQKKNMTKTKFPSTKVSPARLSSIFYNQNLRITRGKRIDLCCTCFGCKPYIQQWGGVHCHLHMHPSL